MPGHDNVYHEPDDALMTPSQPKPAAAPAAQTPPPREPYDMALVARKPRRLYIIDERAPKDEENNVLTVQFNPEEFEEQCRVLWAKMEAPGVPHRALQYMGTENRTVSFTLVFDARPKESGGIEEIMRARSWLLSVCVPRKGATSINEGQAPRLIFVWPNFFSMSCVVTDLSFKYELFDATGTPIRYTVAVKLERVQDFRLYSEDVRDRY